MNRMRSAECGVNLRTKRIHFSLVHSEFCISNSAFEEGGVKPTMVPFTGTAPVMNAILGGQVDYDCDPVLGPLPHVRAGTVKALAIATKKRSPLLPDVPTSYEQGLPEFDCAPFYAVFAPKGTPKPIIDKVNRDLARILATLELKEREAALGYRFIGGAPEKLTAFLKGEIAKWAEVTKSPAFTGK